MTYTEQAELDVGGFGARWGCYATSGSINICEHELGRKLTEDEIDSVVGKWFRMRIADMCNYKNDKFAGANPKTGEPKGWDIEANPEWHWWINNRRAALLIVMQVTGINELVHEYETHILGTPGRHYVTYVVDENITINPDPSLLGDILEKRRIGA